MPKYILQNLQTEDDDFIYDEDCLKDLNLTNLEEVISDADNEFMGLDRSWERSEIPDEIGKAAWVTIKLPFGNEYSWKLIKIGE